MTLRSNNDLRMQDFANSPYHRPQDSVVTVPGGSALPYDVDEDGSWSESGEETFVQKPSLRRRRTVLSLAVIAFTIGALMIVLSSPYSNEFLAPGPLSSSHAQLLAGHGADRCAACHSAGTSSAFGWLAHAFSGASNKMTQSELCLECHKSTINEAFALNPHSVAQSELAKKTGKFKNASFTSNLSMPPLSAENEIACNACHREHKGLTDLKAMTDAQCQSCHQENFHSFESDHPEFTSWPKPSRQKIAFDHSTHFGKHFPSKNTTFDCQQCHLDDAYQNAKIQAPFELACASCHEQRITDSVADGFAFFSLPMLDMKAIEGQSMHVASWPSSAVGAFDGPLPAAMRMLLMADPDARPILESKNSSFDFSDFDPASENDVREAVTLVWSIKRLLHELSLNGKAALKRRMDLVLERNVDEAELGGMFAGLDERTFAAAARRWLPKLSPEIEEKFGGVIKTSVSELARPQQPLARLRLQQQLAENPLAGGAIKQALADESRIIIREAVERPQEVRPAIVVMEDSAARTGWIRDDRLLRLAYRPQGHQDDFLKHWIDIALTTPNAESNDATAALFKSLTEMSSVGNCRYCHTLKRSDDQTFVMNWKASRRDGSIGQFTSFSHRPHLIQPGLQDCSHCHQMDSTVSNNDSFASLDQMDYRSNFKPILKSNCASCHQKGLTSNSCTTCHDYHVGSHKSQ